MALVHADNFSRYGSNTALMVNGVYQTSDNNALVADPDGISSGFVIRQNSFAAAQGELRYVLPSLSNTTGVAIRVWMNRLPVATNDRPSIVDFRNAANGTMEALVVETTGRLSFAGLTTANPVITANGWYHIEISYTTNGVGAFELRVEGVAVLSSADLLYSGHSQTYQLGQHYFGNNFSTTVIYYKDYVVWNETGTYNNNFLGSVLVAGLSVTSDAALNWTPSSGATGYEILDNVPPVDTTYISAGDPPPSPYVGGLSNLPADVTSVKGLITYVRAAKSDGGDGSLQVGMISDPAGTPSTVLGADRPITVAQTWWMDVFETDPETSAPWLPAAVDLAQIQIDRTT